MPGLQGRAVGQGLEILRVKGDSTALLSRLCQILPGLWHQTGPDHSTTSTMDSQSDLGKLMSFSELQFIHFQNAIIYTQVSRRVEKVKAIRNPECPALAYRVRGL